MTTAIIGEFITLGLMAIALGMDAFSVSLGIGMMKLRLKRIFIIGLTIGIFHIFMPFLGIVLGQFLSSQFGTIASWCGGVLLIFLGVQMFRSSFQADEGQAITPYGFGLIIFALSVSLDSFSVGLSLGMSGVKTFMSLIMFGSASAALTWAGLLLARKVSDFFGKYSELLGGSILCGFGLQILLS